VIALGNSSDQPVRANLSLASGKSQFVDIGPFATEIVRLNSDIHGSAAAGRVEAVSIKYVGPEGSLIPAGYTSSANGRFASMIRFYDARQIVQQNLYANNLRVKNARPHMVLRNVSTDFITATPAFLPPSGDADQSVKLSPIQLAPSEVVEVDLDPLLKAASNRSDLDSVSVQVSNTGNPSSLIGALYSLNAQTGITYDVPLRDSGPPRASTGSYSVRFDDDYTTVVAISNTTDQPGEFTMQINYDGGPYVTGIIPIAPGATKTFDIRKLRDEQKPDVNGRPLQRNLEFAQVRWSVRGKVRLNGRAEVVSVKNRVSSSYSCFICCPNSTGSGFITPFNVTVVPGATVGFTAWEDPFNTGGQSCGPDPAPYPTSGFWESDTESVATVNGGDATAIGAGFASISCYWTGTVYVWDDLDESCDVFETETEPAAGMTVVSVTLAATGTQEVGKSDHYISLINTGNVTITATLNPSGADPSIIQWTGGSAGADNLHRVVSTSAASDTNITATVQSQSASVRIHVVDATTPPAAAVDAPKNRANGGTITTNGNFGRHVTLSPAEGVNYPTYTVNAHFNADRWVFRVQSISHTYKLGINSLGKIDLPVGNPPVFPLAQGLTLEQSHSRARSDLDTTGLPAGQGPPRTSYWVQFITENHEQFHVNDYYSTIYWLNFMGLFESQDVEAATVNVIFDCNDTTTTTKSAAITKKTPTWNTAISNRHDQTFAAYGPGAETRAHAASNPQYVPIRNAIPNP
jgi:hypothetical protein